MLVHDDDDKNYTDDYGSKDYINCVEQTKHVDLFQCFMCKSWAHTDCSGWDVQKTSYRH